MLTHAQLLGTSLIASSVTAVLCFGLPDYLPGKRAFAVQLLIFHAIVSALWLQADPVVLHGLLSLVISGWYVVPGTCAKLTQQVANYGAVGAAGCAPGELARQVALTLHCKCMLPWACTP